MLKIDSIGFKYNEYEILKNVYLNIDKGIYGLLGLNGVGKTTLFNCLTGYFLKNTGVLKIENEFIPNNQRWKYFGYLYQTNFLPKEYKVDKIINRFCYSKEDCNKIKTDKRIYKVLRNKIRNLSGGEKRYLEVLLVLSMKRNFYILDEPFSEVEPIYIEEIKKKIKETSKKYSILLTDHKYREIIDVSDNLLLLKDQEIRELGKDIKKLKEEGYCK